MEGYEKEFQPNKLAHKVSLFTTYPTAACARGVVVDTRIVAPSQEPVGSVATGRYPPAAGPTWLACTEHARLIRNRRLATKGGHEGAPVLEPPVGDKRRSLSRF